MVLWTGTLHKLFIHRDIKLPKEYGNNKLKYSN